MSKPSRPVPTAPAVPPGSTVPDDRPTSALRQAALRLATSAVTTAFRVYRIHPAIWRFMARNYHPAMERFARLNAWMICQHAYLDVPAYRERRGGRLQVPLVGPHQLPPDLQARLRGPLPGGRALLARRHRDRRDRRRRVERLVGHAVQLDAVGASCNTVHKNVAGYIDPLFPARSASSPSTPSRWAPGPRAPTPASRCPRSPWSRTPARTSTRSSTPSGTSGPGHLPGQRLPAVPQAPARPARRRGLRLGPLRLNGFVGGEAHHRRVARLSRRAFRARVLRLRRLRPDHRHGRGV